MLPVPRPPHFFMVGIVLVMLFGAGYFWLFVSALTFPKLFMSFFKHVMASNSLLNSFLDFSRWELLTRGLNPLTSSPPPPDLLRHFIEVMRRLSSYLSFLFLRCPASLYSMLLTSLFSWSLVLSRLIFMSYWIELPSSKTAGFTKILLPSADCRAFSRHSSSRMLICCDISLMIFFWLSSSSTIIFLDRKSVV